MFVTCIGTGFDGCHLYDYVRLSNYRGRGRLQIGFLMDGVRQVRDLRQFAPNVKSVITYVDDPQYFQFADGVKVFGGNTLVIEVRERRSFQSPACH